MDEISGVLLLDKPERITSRRAVDKVSKILGVKKAGHTGTLDYSASGLLVVCLGRATKIASFLTALDKEYEAVVRLGEKRTTDDIQGDVVYSREVNASYEDVKKVVEKFVGSIEQIPPEYSAKHIDGERAYRLAMKGQKVPLKPQRVFIHRIEIVNFNGKDIHLKVRCSSGTYMRSLARDIGEELGCGGFLYSLRRTAVGSFRVEDASSLEDVEKGNYHLITPADALSFMPKLTAVGSIVRLVKHGGRLHPSLFLERPIDSGLYRIVSPDGKLLAVVSYIRGEMKYERVLGGI